MKKNNFVKTDIFCQFAAGEGKQGASKIDRTFHFSNTPTCVICERAIYDVGLGSMFCQAHNECTCQYYTCELWQRNR